MKKTRLTMLLALTMLIALCLAACGGEKAPEKTAAPTGNAQTEKNGDAAQANAINPDEYELIDVAHFDRTFDVDVSKLGTYTLDLSTHDPSTSMKCMFLEEWARLVREASGGGIDITVYNGGTLASPAEALAAAEMGTADMAWIIASNFADQLPATGMFYLPGLQLEYIPRDCSIMWDLYEKYPAFEQDYTRNNLKLLHMYTTGTTGVYGPEVRSLADLKGKNIRTLGGYASDMISLLGASPISMGPGDMYDALSKNVIDGYTIEWSGVKTYRVYEVTKWYNMDNLYTSPMALIMNLDSYNELPEEYREIIDYYSGREMSLQMAYLWDRENSDAMAEYSEPSQILHYSDYDKVLEVLCGYSSRMAESLKTDEFDAVAFYNDILDSVKSYDESDWSYYREQQ